MGKEEKQQADAGRDQRHDVASMQSGSLYQPAVADNTRVVGSATQLARTQGAPPATSGKKGELPAWVKAGLAVAEITDLLLHLHCDMVGWRALNIFDWHRGDFWGTVDGGQLLMVAKLLAPDKMAFLVGDLATYKSNKFTIKGNLFDGNLSITSAQVHVGGLKTKEFSTGAGNLTNLNAKINYYNKTASVSFSSATLAAAEFKQGSKTIKVDSLGIYGLRFSGMTGNKLGAAGLAFSSAQMTRLRYPGFPPISMSIAGGNSFAAIWANVPKAPEKKKSDTPALGDLKLPATAEVKVTLVGIHAAGAMVPNFTGGAAGFDFAKVAMVDKGTELASITIKQFVAGGSQSGTATTGGMRMKELTVIGQPDFVEMMANAPAMQPQMQPALKMVRDLGLKPRAGIAVRLSDIGAAGGTNGATSVGALRGNFEAAVAVPSLGTASVSLRGFVIGAAQAGGLTGAGTAFDTFKAQLVSADNSNIASIELSGGAGGMVGKVAGAKLSGLKASGDVTALIKALDPIMDSAPAGARGAIAAVKSLGLTGTVSGANMAVTQDAKGGITYAGDFHAGISAGGIGTISLDVINVRGTESSLTSMSKFKLALVRSGGKTAASLEVRGLKGNAATKTKNAGMHADHIGVTGDAGEVQAMIAQAMKRAPTLSAPLRQALHTVQELGMGANASVSLNDVSATQNKKGAISAQLGSLNAGLSVPGIGQVSISLKGLSAAGSKTAGNAKFSHLEIKAKGTDGQPALRVAVDGVNASAKASGDGSASIKKIAVEGDTGRIGQMMKGVTEQVSSLPPAAASGIVEANRYMLAFPIEFNSQLTDLKLGQKAGVQTASGNVSADFAMPIGKVSLKARNVSFNDGTTTVESFTLNVTDKAGKTVATLGLVDGKAAIGESGVVEGHVGTLVAAGDTKLLAEMLTPEARALMPAAALRVLNSVPEAQFKLALSGVSASKSETGEQKLGLSTMLLAADVRLKGVGGHNYNVTGAQIALHGAKAEFDEAGKLKEVGCSSLQIRGAFASDEGKVLSGNAVITTGPGTAHFTAGTLTSVEASNIKISGSGAMQDGDLGLKPADPNKAGMNKLDAARMGVELIQDLEVHTHTPVQAGRYGRGLFQHIDVPGGAGIHINLRVQKQALVPAQTNVQIIPQFHYQLGAKIGGVHLEQRGTEAVLQLDLGGLLGKLVGGAGNFVLDFVKMPLDLSDLLKRVVDVMHLDTKAAESGAAKAEPTPTSPEDLAKVAADHAEWKADADEHAKIGNDKKRKKKQAEDVRTEPRTASVSGLFKEGVQLDKTTGTADVALAGNTSMGGGDVHLTGKVHDGGKANLTLAATKLEGDVGGGKASVSGMDVAASGSREGDISKITISGMSFENVSWTKAP